MEKERKLKLPHTHTPAWVPVHTAALALIYSSFIYALQVKCLLFFFLKESFFIKSIENGVDLCRKTQPPRNRATGRGFWCLDRTLSSFFADVHSLLSSLKSLVLLDLFGSFWQELSCLDLLYHGAQSFALITFIRVNGRKNEGATRNKDVICFVGL